MTTDRERAREIRITFENFIIGEYNGVATAAKLEALALAALTSVRAETAERTAKMADQCHSIADMLGLAGKIRALLKTEDTDG